MRGRLMLQEWSEKCNIAAFEDGERGYDPAKALDGEKR